ncbi:helix-turn-helix transcriptional regulator [Curtobacterium sp. C1]|uniref:helix-turn-helix domain-containing protein n=1 Tax=Curtobacterium sp. C1 TaxID=2898151 RepID=UPI001E4B499B|nr:helix-turn-helix transcriptional regulator [Curtobacterium sp. C1]UFU14591.1 helix-turn-helix transcriptional regulator [Curtobacterium sp. C1]
MPETPTRSPLNSAVAAELRAARAVIQPKVTYSALTAKTGLHKNVLMRIFEGQREITTTHLGLVAYALGVEPEELLRKAVDRMGGLEVLTSDGGGTVTPLRKRPEDMTMDELDAEPYAAQQSTPEAEADEQF